MQTITLGISRWLLMSTVLFLTSVGRGEDSNRNDVRGNLEKDGWTVIWGKNFTEGDWVQGTKAIAESIATENPGPFLIWFESTLQENFRKIQENLRGTTKQQIEKWILDSLNRKQIVTFGQFRIEAGFATYNRWNRTVHHEPRPYWNGPFDNGVRWVKVENKIPLPNWHQFYIRYRLGGGSNQNTTGGNMVTNRMLPSTWETFTIEHVGDRIALKFHTGYLCAEGGGGGAVRANRNEVQGWELWKLVRNSNGTVSLQSGTGHFLCAENRGSSPPVVNRPSIGPWEQWQLIEVSRGRYALKACNNRFLCSEP